MKKTIRVADDKTVKAASKKIIRKYWTVFQRLANSEQDNQAKTIGDELMKIGERKP